MSVSTSSTSLSPHSRSNNQFDPIKSMKASLLGLMNVAGLSRRILARFLQTFNSNVYGVPTVLLQPGPSLCHVKEVDTVTSIVEDNACGRGKVPRKTISAVFGTPVSLQSSVELEVPHCAEFLLRRGRSEPESAQLRRDSSMNWTVGHSRRVVHNTALQHVIFNADSTIIERMSCVQCRRSQVTSSSLVHFLP